MASTGTPPPPSRSRRGAGRGDRRRRPSAHRASTGRGRRHRAAARGRGGGGRRGAPSVCRFAAACRIQRGVVMPGYVGILLIVVLGLFLLSRWVRILREYERAVVFRLGRLLESDKGPGVVLIFWPLDTVVIIPLRTVVHDVPPQDIITRDNVSVKVNAVVYFRVVDPAKAVVEVENYLYATSQLAQTTLRSVLGQAKSTSCSPSATSSTPSSRRSSTTRPTRGASRCRRWRSSTSTCRSRCSAPWRARLRPSARSGRRSSMPRASSRRPSSSLRRPTSSPQPGHPAAALPADADRDRLGEQLDHRLPAPHRDDAGVPQARRPEVRAAERGYAGSAGPARFGRCQPSQRRGTDICREARPA